MINIDAASHSRGESVYLDDIPEVAGTLYGAAVDSPVAHGTIVRLDITDAAAMYGVRAIITAKDITGENQIGGIVPDEPLLAVHTVDFRGMPIAFVVADSPGIASDAVKKIIVEIAPLPVTTDPRKAMAAGELIVPPRRFTLGNTETCWQQCPHVFSGTADTNGQEHLYIETQGAYALPQENNALKIYSSTQGPTAVQRAASRVTGLPMHQVEVEVIRLGGGFGGKEDQANMWAALCALAAHRLKKPVKYILNRIEDMAMTGKRHPYSADYRIGLDQSLRIMAYEVTFYQNAGAVADLSPAVLERTLFHCTNTYFIPNVTATAYSCRTNLPPNTAFRGFGGPQGMFVLEAAIVHAAETFGIEADVIQKINLNRTGDLFPYGQPALSEARNCWQQAEALYETGTWKNNIAGFNASSRLIKKGLAFMPVCFGISFTKTMMNQARALVHVYTDGSVGVSTGAVEMGQGVNTKMLQVAAQVFSIDPGKVKIQTTSTNKIANTSPSAASATADLNGKAVQMACTAILQRLKQMLADETNAALHDIEMINGTVCIAGKKTEWDWYTLVAVAYTKRISLSEHAHYATPGINFDPSAEKGNPFAYHVYGTSITEVTIDCLRGTYSVDAVKVVHDFGSSMNIPIDKGQIEGGIVQGIGWMTIEEIVYDPDGRLRSNTLSTYKVPDIYAAPREIMISFLRKEHDNPAILQSKAVGEPPLMYGIGTYFALRNAIRAFNPQTVIPFNAPMTPEKVLMALYSAPAENTKHEPSAGHLATH